MIPGLWQITEVPLFSWWDRVHFPYPYTWVVSVTALNNMVKVTLCQVFGRWFKTISFHFLCFWTLSLRTLLPSFKEAQEVSWRNPYGMGLKCLPCFLCWASSQHYHVRAVREASWSERSLGPENLCLSLISPHPI